MKVSVSAQDESCPEHQSRNRFERRRSRVMRCRELSIGNGIYSIGLSESRSLKQNPPDMPRFQGCCGRCCTKKSWLPIMRSHWCPAHIPSVGAGQKYMKRQGVVSASRVYLSRRQVRSCTHVYSLIGKTRRWLIFVRSRDGMYTIIYARKDFEYNFSVRTGRSNNFCVPPSRNRQTC